MADNQLMEEIIAKLSIKYKLPKAAIRAICDSPFRVLSENVKGNTLNGVNFNYIGKFAIRETKKKRIIEDPVKEKQRDLDKYEEKHEKWKLAEIEKQKELHAFKTDTADNRRMGKFSPEGL